MEHVLDIQPVQIAAGSIHRIDAGKGLQVTAVQGVVWVTQANDPRDVILSRGQSFILDRSGLAVAYALKDAAIVVGPAGHITAASFDPSAVQKAA
jgi:hypothetical protein